MRFRLSNRLLKSLRSSRSLVKAESSRHKGKTMRKLKLFGVAFALAAGAFVLTMLKDPPQSVASDPSRTIQPLDIQVQTGIPTGDYGAAAN